MGVSRQAFAEKTFAQAWAPSQFDVARAARMRDLLTRRPPGHLLDVGCWDGRFITRVVPAQRVIGVDVAAQALTRARRSGLIGVRAQTELGLPFQADAFATIVAAEIIEHVFDTQRFLDELVRVLRPGGWLVTTTPNLVALSGRAQILLGRSPHNIEFDASPGTSGHIRYFTFETLERLLRTAGLRPLGRWTNLVHFSVLGGSELAGRVRPGLGHTLISIAQKPA